MPQYRGKELLKKLSEMGTPNLYTLKRDGQCKKNVQVQFRFF